MGNSVLLHESLAEVLHHNYESIQAAIETCRDLPGKSLHSASAKINKYSEAMLNLMVMWDCHWLLL